MSENPSHFQFNSKFNFRCDKGFAAVLLTSLLPVLLTLAFIIPIGLRIFQIQKEQRHACRAGLLRYQTIASETIQKIRALNTRASALRAQKNVAKAMLLVPATAAAGLRLLNQVNRQQRSLGLRQKLLLQQGKLQMSYSLYDIQKKLRKLEPSSRVPFSPPYIAIRPDTYPDIAPVYVLEHNFTTKQAKQVSWKSRYTFPGEDIWTKWTGFKAIKHQESCAATLVEKSHRLQAELTKAKPLPSFSSRFFF